MYTFSKEGEFIDKLEMIGNGCFMDCGYRKCTSDCIINEERKIAIIDTVDFYECDDNGEEISESRKYFVETNTFHRSRLGKFIRRIPVKNYLMEK